MAYKNKTYDPKKAHEYYMKHRKLKGRKKSKAKYVDTKGMEKDIKKFQEEMKQIPKGKAGKVQRDRMRKELKAMRNKLKKTRQTNKRVLERNRRAIQKTRDKLKKKYGSSVLSHKSDTVLKQKRILSSQLEDIKKELQK